MASASRMDSFTTAYFDAALWASSDESDGEPLDKNYDISDIAPETRDRMIADCADFQERFAELIGGETEQAGHDFWLTRNGHGAGFWDGDWPEPDATTLTDGSKEYGETYLYVDDDGQIHGHEETRKRGAAREVRAAGRHVADINPALIEAFAADVDEFRESQRITFEQAFDTITKPYWLTQYKGDRIALENQIISRAKSIGRVRQGGGRGVRAPRHVRDYEAIDRHDRVIAGPFKSYGDAKDAAGSAGAVRFVPKKKATEAREPSRSAHHLSSTRRRHARK